MNKTTLAPQAKSAGLMPSSQGILQRKCACGTHAMAGGECEECKKNRLGLQRNASDRNVVTEVPPVVQEVLRSPGQPLDLSTRDFFEPRFGHDFSQVRVHTDFQAAKSAQAVNALAYTVGRDIVFDADQYAPQSFGGKKLLAHELAHILQQSSGESKSPKFVQLEIDEASSPEELESEAVADAVINASPHDSPSYMHPKQAAQYGRLQRKVSSSLPNIQHLLRKGISAADTHQVLLIFKPMSDEDLRDTVRALETQDKDYIERFLTNIESEDQLNELETLRRIKNARVWKAENKSGGTTVTTEVVGSCSTDQFQKIYQAANTGLGWLSMAVARIDAYIAAPNSAASADVNNALTVHFNSNAGDVVKHIRERLVRIRADIQRAPQFSIECHGVWDRGCANAGAYVGGEAPNMIVFCNSFFGHSAEWQAEAVIHEMAHAQVGGQHITDLAYQSDRLLTFLSTVEALTNAESYGLLVQQLGTGKAVKPTAPQDKTEDCPDEWSRLLQKAIAVAQRWNRNLDVTLLTLKPDALKPPSKWGAYLGGTTQADIDKARKVTERVASKLDSAISFECEPKGGGRCDKYATYWYVTGDLHICPKWKIQATEEARVQSLLAGLFGYVGDVDDETRRNYYAQLAQENNASWRTPMLGEILGGSQWTPDNINISVVPRQPKTSKYMYTESGKTHERLSNDLPTAQIPAPPLRMLVDNFQFDVNFHVDYGAGGGRPLPFTPPEISAEIHYIAPKVKFDRTHSDRRPVYMGEGQPLETNFKREFKFSIDMSGSMQMRFELKDPDTNIVRQYDDTLQINVVSQPGQTP